MSLNPCETCTKDGMALCPRHGLNRVTKKPKGNPLLKNSSLKPSKLKPASDRRAEEKKTWALIKKTMTLAQLRTNGFTSCMECGAQNPSPIDLDHITPSGKGGKWTPENAQLLCRGCHNAKHRNLPEWTERKG